MSYCGTSGFKMHDIQDQDHRWRKLDFWLYQTILYAKIPKVTCESCEKIRTVIIDWARSGAVFYMLFKYHVLSLMIEMLVVVARKFGEYDTRLWRVFRCWQNCWRDWIKKSGYKWNFQKFCLFLTSKGVPRSWITGFVTACLLFKFQVLKKTCPKHRLHSINSMLWK